MGEIELRTLIESTPGLAICIQHSGLRKGEWDHNAWIVTVTYGGRQYSTDYKTGLCLKDWPSPTDVLSCLLSDAYDAYRPFEEWADDFGYDSDSGKAERIWTSCGDTRRALIHVLGATLFAQMSEARS